MDTLADIPQSSLSGVARVLVHAGKLNAKAAEDLVKSAKDKRSSFVASVIAAGAVTPSELSHTLANALAIPLLDLNAVDAQKLPRNIIEAKLAAQYQVVVLGKRGNRLFIGGADPTDQEAVERIKIATRQLARRQMKWFRRFPDVTWIPGDQPLERLVELTLTGFPLQSGG